MNGTLGALLEGEHGENMGRTGSTKGKIDRMGGHCFVTDFLMRSLPRLSLREPNRGTLLHELRCPERGPSGIRRIVVQLVASELY